MDARSFFLEYYWKCQTGFICKAMVTPCYKCPISFGTKSTPRIYINIIDSRFFMSCHWHIYGISHDNMPWHVMAMVLPSQNVMATRHDKAIAMPWRLPRDTPWHRHDWIQYHLHYYYLNDHGPFHCTMEPSWTGRSIAPWNCHGPFHGNTMRQYHGDAPVCFMECHETTCRETPCYCRGDVNGTPVALPCEAPWQFVGAHLVPWSIMLMPWSGHGVPWRRACHSNPSMGNTTTRREKDNLFSREVKTPDWCLLCWISCMSDNFWAE